MMRSDRRRYVYPFVVVAILICWAAYMTAAQRWGLFRTLWPLSVTMVFGSFIAGATPQGSAAVAFPVFTKVLAIEAADARTFGLMIQSVGMSVASLTIVLRGTRILTGVLFGSVLGSTIGMVLGTYVVVIPTPYPKLMFTLMLTTFGLALILSRWFFTWHPLAGMPLWNGRILLLFAAAGTIGGIVAAHTGSGADSIAFTVMTLAFGLDERASTPTTVLIMAANSLTGFFLHGVVSQDIGRAWDYWLVAVPVVIFGAPLGAYVLSRINRDALIYGILILIALELVTTLVLIRFDRLMVFATLGAIAFSIVAFRLMLNYRSRTVKPLFTPAAAEPPR